MPASSTEAAHAYGVMLKAIEEGSNAYPKPGGVTYSYGTAGFRMK